MTRSNLRGVALGNSVNPVEKQKISKAFVDEVIERWAENTAEMEEAQAQVPMAVLLGETVDLAAMVDAYFAPHVGDKISLPGLESVVKTGQVSPTTAAELRELQLAIGVVHAELGKLAEQAQEGPVERGEELEIELRSALTFLLEDGQHPTGEQQLARLRAEHSPIASHDGLALALEGYAALAEEHRELLGTIGFDVSFIDEARGVAQALRQRSATRLSGELASQQRTLGALRGRLIAALYVRLRSARRAFRYVFRGYPEIVRKAQSKHERERRRAYRAGESGIPETDDGLDADFGDEGAQEVTG